MSEEQEKPKRTWYKNWRAVLAWCSVIFIVSLIVSVLVIYFNMVTGKQFATTDGGSAYPTAREQMQNAITAYQANNNNSLPILSGTYTNANCSNCSVINMSALLTANGGVLRMAPDCLNLSASGNDNCGGNASLGCVNGSHYIWIVDTSGEVFSYCTGAGCATNNSGYQGVWP
jgi:hypothetical protein